MYKPQKMTYEIAYRRTVKNCLARVGYTKQEIQDLMDAGVEEAESIWLSIQEIAQDRANLYSKENTNVRI